MVEHVDISVSESHNARAVAFTGDPSLFTPPESGRYYVRTDVTPNQLYRSTGTTAGDVVLVGPAAGTAATVAVDDVTATTLSPGTPATADVTNTGTTAAATLAFDFGLPRGEDGFVFQFEFDSATTSGPSAGEIRLNNVDPSSASELYISRTDDDGRSIGEILDEAAANSTFLFYKLTDKTTFAAFTVSSNTDNGSDNTIAVSPISNSGTFSDGDACGVTFAQAGATGPAATLAVGTVSTNTLSAGSNADATVTNAGTSSAAEFDFVFDIPQGADGTDGTDGTDGISAVSTTTSDFTQPSSSSTVNVDVDSTAAMQVGQYLYTASNGGNTYLVDAIVNSSTVSLENPARFDGINASSGTTISSGATLISSGIPGEDGTDGTNATGNTGLRYLYDNTTSTPAGTNEIRWNNASPGSASEVYVSATDADGNTSAPKLNLISPGTAIHINKKDASSAFAVFVVNSITDNSSYQTMEVTPLSNGGTFSDGDEVFLTIDLGDRGEIAANSLLGNDSGSSARASALSYATVRSELQLHRPSFASDSHVNGIEAAVSANSKLTLLNLSGAYFVVGGVVNSIAGFVEITIDGGTTRALPRPSMELADGGFITPMFIPPLEISLTSVLIEFNHPFTGYTQDIGYTIFYRSAY